MNVAEAKAQIVKALEELRSGAWVRAIRLSWSTEVAGSDKAKLDSETKCKITLEADL